MTNSQILDAINQNIKRNENKEITGVILNSVLRMLLDFVNQGFITFSDIIQLLADSKAINVVGSINTTTETTSLPSGVYHTQTSGTYTNASGIVVKEGYYTLLIKKDDCSWVLESEVKMPMHDLTKIETELESTKTKVDEFIRDFSVTTDTEFNAKSNNPIANSAVTPLSEILDGFFCNDPNETIGKDLATFGGLFLRANDEIEYNSSYPKVGLIYKLDVSDSIELNISGLVRVGNSPKIILGGYKKDGSYSILVRPEDSNLSDLKTFEITDYNTISIQVFSDAFPAIQIKKYGGKCLKVKEYVDNNVGTGSLISLKEKAKIVYPTNLIELNFETRYNLPTAKGTLAKGVLNYTDNAGTSFKKFATLEVQGSSSAFHPKKNWTFALFNKEDYSDDFKLRIGNLAPHSEFVFKSNWIDATHCRNILSNKIWEDIVQSRKYFPKRENEVAYLASNTNVDQRFDSGALCHVDGMPAKLFVNGNFYGIGMFNLGKKRENYDLKSSNQNHIQLAAEMHTNFNSYVAEKWEIRNPKTPDANFLTKINAWFASNALAGQTFKDNFEINHDLKNAIDFFLLAEFIQSTDMYTKNLILTSWDGVKFYFLPYDMDTTFGLQWDGLSYTGHTTSIRSSQSFWQKFYSTYTVEIKARYKELRDNGVFTLENVYRHADKMNKTFGVDNFKEEFEAWTQVPSNSTIYTSYNQIYQWVKDRLIWLDSQYL